MTEIQLRRRPTIGAIYVFIQVNCDRRELCRLSVVVYRRTMSDQDRLAEIPVCGWWTGKSAFSLPVTEFG